MNKELLHIINEDCMALMARYPDKHFDLAIVDPPYGLGASNKAFMRQGKQTGKSMAVSGLRYTAKDWDTAIPDEAYFKELQRVSKNQIIWGGNYFINYLKSTSCMLVWDKVNGDNLYADCEIAWTSFNSAVRKVKYRWHGMLQADMKNKEIRIHPTQKPIALYKWLLSNYAKNGDKILDTHMGSGSIAIACQQMGYDLTACELDKDYYEAALKRIELNTRQTSIF